MLCLKRNVQEKIQIANNITVVVLDCGPGWVKLGVEAPREVPVDRYEIHLRKQGQH